MKFDLGRAWNDGVTKLRDNFQLLALIAGLFLFLPSAVFAIVAPDIMALAMASPMDPSDPEALLSLFTPSIVIGYIVIILLSFAGYIAMLALIDGLRKPTVGEAIAFGFKALPTVIGAILLFAIAYAIIAVLLSLIVGLVAGAIAVVSATLGAIVGFLLVVGLIIVILWAFTRFSMIMPVIAIGKVMNPVTAIRESWNITRGAQWRLLAFYLLLFVAYLVIALLVFGLLGVLIGTVGGGTVLAFLNALVSAFVGMLFAAILAGIFAQLSGTHGATLTDTFE